jgi:hypothetical protein
MDIKLQAQSKDSHGNITKVIHRKKSSNGGNIGCVAKMATLVKRDIIKHLNHAASFTHGISITLVNPEIKVDSEGNRKYEKCNIKANNSSTEMHVNRKKVC